MRKDPAASRTYAGPLGTRGERAMDARPDLPVFVNQAETDALTANR